MLKNYRNHLLVWSVLFISISASAQYARRQWHAYVSPSVGMMYYVGDLKKNSMPEDAYLHPTIGLQLAMQYDQLFTAQIGYTRGAMSGYDTLVSDVLKNRGYEFYSKTHDIEMLFKLTLLNTKKRVSLNSDPVFHPRLMAGFGLLHFNPTAEYNGEMVELQKLGTAGQQLGNPAYPEPYSLWAFGLKFGSEINIQTGPRTGFNLYGYYTFAMTDYLDDVGGDPHLDMSDLANAENPELLREFAYARNLDRELINTPSHTRGNPDANDGYFNFGLAFTYRISEAGRYRIKY